MCSTGISSTSSSSAFLRTGSGGARGPGSVSGIVLAGGSSSRLGQDKALVQLAGRSLLQRVVDVLYTVVVDIVLVTPSAELFANLGLPAVADVYPGVGTLGGLHAGLSAIHSEYGLVVGCDMPFLNAGLLRYIIAQAPGYDVVMPRVGKYHEPLHTLYARRCAPVMERSILSGQRRILHALADARIRYIEESEIATYDPDHLSFFNVNTPEELERAQALLAP